MLHKAWKAFLTVRATVHYAVQTVIVDDFYLELPHETHRIEDNT